MKATRSRVTVASITGTAWFFVVAVLFSVLPFAAQPTQAVGGTLTFGTPATATAFDATCAVGGSPTFSGTLITEDPTYELRPALAFEDYFTGASLGAQWTSGPLTAGTPTFVVANSMLTITPDASNNGGYVLNSADMSDYGVFEAMVQFNGDSQVAGLSESPVSPNRYALFSTLNNAAWNSIVEGSNGFETLPLRSPLDTTQPHLLRIEWYLSDAQANDDQFVFAIDGSTVGNHASGHGGVSNVNRMRFVALDGSTTPVQILWARYAEQDVAASGTYTSCPLQVANGQRQIWGPVSWVGRNTTPLNSQLAGPGDNPTTQVEFRSGNTLVELGNASWVSVATGGTPNVAAGEYGQYRITLSSNNSANIPTVDSVSVGYVTLGATGSNVQSIEPSTGDYGTQFLALADGFAPNTAVTINLSGASTGTLNTTADGFGEVAFYLNSTPAMVGSYTAAVSGDAATSGTRSFNLNFTVTGGTSPAATPPAPGGTPTLNMPSPAECADDVSPSYVIAGDSVTLTACDFQRNATLTSTLDSVANGFSPSVNVNGALSTTFSTTGMTAGTHALVLSGTHFSGSGTETATFNIRIARTNAVTPSSARDGTFFLVEGRGMGNNAPLTVTLDGSPVSIAPSLSSDAVGEFAFYLNSTNATSGAHSVSITDGTVTVGPLAFTVDVAGTLGVQVGSPLGSMPAPACNIGTLQFNPSFGSAGTAVQVQACGFGRNAPIAIRVDGNLIAQTTAADANGAVNFSLDTTGFTPGLRSIELRSSTTFPRAASQLTRTANLTITQPAVMDPTSGRYDTLFRASGDGFNTGATLTLTLDGVFLGTINADGAGQYDLYLDSTLAETGSHTLVVTGSVGASTGAETFNFTVLGTGTPVTPNPGAVTVFDMPAPSCVVGGSVSPTTGNESTSFTMTGCGFGRNATLNVSIDGIAVGTVNSDVNGRFSHPINTSALADGTHSVAVSGSPFSGATPRTVTGSFTLDLASFSVYLPLVLAP
jgi:hypothetical protein